jgi:acyl-CoA synthetase (AMP-forming)/AMP-acid ligase II
MTATEQELIEFCTSKLAGFKVPKSIDFYQSLPKGGTGKILKRELRERYWKGYEKRVH